jgi:D-alanine-D-alanine ligase
MSKIKVAVLMGGNSAEREISLWTGRQILDALDQEKYVVYALDTATGQKVLSSPNDGDRMHYFAGENSYPVSKLTELPLVEPASRPDVVVIALHGPGGEDGTVQGMLELLHLPYTGSKVLASALAMDKAMTKRVLTAGGVRMPKDVTLKGRHMAKCEKLESLGLPLVVKPNTQGSTIGMTIVKDRSDLESA